MVKVQQKVSGCFRSKEGAEIFCLIRSYFITCNKSNANPMDAFQLVFGGNLPSFIFVQILIRQTILPRLNGFLLHPMQKCSGLKFNV
jgi:hypothetical protein